MIRVGLYEPRIPQNTGNIGRTCLAFNSKLDLICPLGFSLEDRYLKRAGLDYWKYLEPNIHEDFLAYKNSVGSSRIIGFSKKGGISLNDMDFQLDDCLLFGREDIGLPSIIRDQCNIICSIQMPGIISTINPNGVRSLNLSVACGIALYNAITINK